MKIILWIIGIIAAIFILFYLPNMFIGKSTNVSVDTFFELSIWKVVTIVYCGGLAVFFLYVKTNASYQQGRLINVFIASYGGIAGVWLLWVFAGWFLPPAVQGVSQFLAENIGAVVFIALIIALFYKD